MASLAALPELRLKIAQIPDGTVTWLRCAGIIAGQRAPMDRTSPRAPASKP